MPRKLIGNVGLLAVVLLAPGGFILGATLVARRYRNRAGPAGARDDHARTGSDEDRAT